MEGEVYIPTNTYLKPLSETEKGALLEAQTRRAGADKEYKPVTWVEEAKLFFNDVKSKLRVGSFVDRAQITNTPDNQIKVVLAGEDLSNYLPDSVRFVGWKITDKPDFSKHETDHMSSFYDPFSHTIGFPIEKSPNITDVRLFQDLENSGLVGLHEIGHAQDDEKRADRLDEILKWELKCKASNFFGQSRILRPETIKSLTESGQTSDANLDQKVGIELRSFFEEFILPNNKQLMDGVVARKLDQNVFLNDVIKEVTNNTKEIFAQGVEFSKIMNSDDLAKFIKERSTDRVNEYQQTYDQLLSDESATSERNAWANALVMARKITKEKGGVLWNKSLEELFFYIDSSINDHGEDAGRKGVKNANNRRDLNIVELGIQPELKLSPQTIETKIDVIVEEFPSMQELAKIFPESKIVEPHYEYGFSGDTPNNSFDIATGNISVTLDIAHIENEMKYMVREEPDSLACREIIRKQIATLSTIPELPENLRQQIEQVGVDLASNSNDIKFDTQNFKDLSFLGFEKVQNILDANNFDPNLKQKVYKYLYSTALAESTFAVKELSVVAEIITHERTHYVNSKNYPDVIQDKVLEKLEVRRQQFLTQESLSLQYDSVTDVNEKELSNEELLGVNHRLIDATMTTISEDPQVQAKYREIATRNARDEVVATTFQALMKENATHRGTQGFLRYATSGIHLFDRDPNLDIDELRNKVKTADTIQAKKEVVENYMKNGFEDRNKI